MEKKLCKGRVKFRENDFNVSHRGLRRASLLRDIWADEQRLMDVRKQAVCDYLGEENSGQKEWQGWSPCGGVCSARPGSGKENGAGARCTGAEWRELTEALPLILRYGIFATCLEHVNHKDECLSKDFLIYFNFLWHLSNVSGVILILQIRKKAWSSGK